MSYKEKYIVSVELKVEVEVVNDSSSVGMIAGYVERHIKNLMATNYEMAPKREVRSVKIDYCKAEQIP